MIEASANIPSSPQLIRQEFGGTYLAFKVWEGPDWDSNSGVRYTMFDEIADFRCFLQRVSLSKTVIFGTRYEERERTQTKFQSGLADT